MFALLLEDYERQGLHLDIVQVERTINKRGLRPSEAAWIYRQIDAQGISLEQPASFTRERSENDSGPERPNKIASFDSNIAVGLSRHRYRPLTRAEEAALGRRITIANAARHELSAGTLRPTSEIDRIIADGEDARSILVQANLPFAASVAKQFHPHTNLPFDDLLQEGAKALVRAVDKFDPERGLKFISYAVWWIRQAMLQVTAEYGGSIRLPLNVHSDLLRMRKIRRRLLRLNGGALPAPKDLARALEWPLEKTHFFLELESYRSQSVDAPVGAAPGLSFGDIIPDAAPMPDAIAQDALMDDAINLALGTLKERQRTVIELYFGLNGYEPITLEAIGERLGVTRERIRQIKEAALVRLRHASRSRTLQAFFDDLSGSTESSADRKSTSDTLEDSER